MLINSNHTPKWLPYWWFNEIYLPLVIDRCSGRISIRLRAVLKSHVQSLITKISRLVLEIVRLTFATLIESFERWWTVLNTQQRSFWKWHGFVVNFCTIWKQPAETIGGNVSAISEIFLCIFFHFSPTNSRLIVYYASLRYACQGEDPLSI